MEARGTEVKVFLGGFVSRSWTTKTVDVPDAWSEFVRDSRIMTLDPGEVLVFEEGPTCCDLPSYSVELLDGTTMSTNMGGGRRPRFAALQKFVIEDDRRRMKAPQTVVF